MLNKIMFRVLPVIANDQMKTVVRLGLLTAVLLATFLMTGTVSAEPIPGLVGG